MSKRQNLRRWIFTAYGDGTVAPCVECGVTLTQETMTIDRHPIPGAFGGTYSRANVRPLCYDCNQADGREIDRIINMGRGHHLMYTIGELKELHEV